MGVKEGVGHGQGTFWRGATYLAVYHCHFLYSVPLSFHLHTHLLSFQRTPAQVKGGQGGRCLKGTVNSAAKGRLLNLTEQTPVVV